MSEVKRFDIEGRDWDLIEGLDWVSSENFDLVLSERDAALAREAALREENNLLRHGVASYLETTAKVCDLLGIDVDSAKNAEGKPSDVLFAHAQALQQRLTDAEKLLREVRDSGDWHSSALEFIHGEGFEVLAKIEAALKPAEGEGS